MNYLNKSFIAILIVIGSFFNEYLYLLFDANIIHSIQENRTGLEYPVYLDDAVFYFINSLFMFLLVLVVFLLTDKQKIASKVILSTVVIWFFIEVLENYCFLTDFNNYVLIINYWSIWQIFITLLSIPGSYYYFTRFKL